jgi:hypothetical protein
VEPVVPAFVPALPVMPLDEDCAVAVTAVASEIAATIAFRCACFMKPPALARLIDCDRTCAIARAG